MVKSKDRLPLTVASIRDQVRNHYYAGDVFDALVFMLQQYDELWSVYKLLNKNIQEYDIKRIDVV